MTKANRKEKEREIRRKDIIDAAERLFFSNDYENVTMNDIAEEAEMARGTLYQYFKNKDDIYAAIAIRAAKLIGEKIHEIMDTDQTALEKLRSFVESHYDLFKKYPGYYNAYYHSGFFDLKDSSTFKKLTEIRKNSFRLGVATVKEGIKEGSIKEDLDPVVTTLFVLSTANNAINIIPVTQMYMDEYGLTHDKLFKLSFDMAIQSIEKNK